MSDAVQSWVKGLKRGKMKREKGLTLETNQQQEPGFYFVSSLESTRESWKTLGKSSSTAFKQQVGPQTFLLPHRDVEPQPALVAGPDLPD